jgi:hypothetical protein
MTPLEKTPVPDAELAGKSAAAPQEVLVTDPREGLTPSQMVEQKLVSLLRGTPLPVSGLQSVGTRRALS